MIYGFITRRECGGPRCDTVASIDIFYTVTIHYQVVMTWT
jgi:hypothetical protein